MLTAFVTEATEEAAAESTNPLLPALPDLVWGTLAFVIILVFFIWKVMPNVNKMLDARADAIEGGMKRAEAAEAQAAAALERYNAQLADARGEAAAIRDAARADGAQIVAEAKQTAQVEAARVTANASAQIEAERQSALVSLRGEVGTLALSLAGGVVGESLSSDKRSKSVVDRFLADLEKSTPASGKAKK